MTRVGFITKSKVLAQSLAETLRTRADLRFEPVILGDYAQAPLDAEVLGIGIAVVDGDGDLPGALAVCTALRAAVPQCRLMLLLSPRQSGDSASAIEAKRAKRIDDFLFCDTSLDYLFAKLASM